MYSEFHNIEDLKQLVVNDKQAVGVGAATLDRYPIRFVLFDNFKDCYEFVEYLQTERGAHVESVDRWIDANYPDLIITHVELAERIEEHIKKKSPNDCVIAPFSELARFYDNDGKKCFDALLKTIKAIQATVDAVNKHQRVYVPIVGLEGKMEMFRNDTQTNIWRLISEEKSLTYRLILTANTDYGVKGLGNNYTIVNDIRQWLNIWKDTKKQVTPQIVCMSRSIYANAQYAQPDNAFSYVVCNNAYEFLVNGLNLSFGGIQPQLSDGNNWELLAESIDVSTGFSFRKYVNSHFGIDDIEDYKDFIRLWFSHPALFDRWLMARYYASLKNEDDYICKILSETSNYGTNEFIENLAINFSDDIAEMQIRRYCLDFAANKNIQLSDAAESMVVKKLQDLPSKVGHSSALIYFTSISQKEKDVAVSWLGQGHLTLDEVKSFYQDLYCYMADGIGVSADVPDWVDNYMIEYKKAKISNRYTAGIGDLIAQLNASEATFDTWYNQFSTTYTHLQDRGDIEVFYWVDGLGVDWIPLIKQIISEKKDQHIFLNEIKVARAILPTKTDVNRTDLQRLLPQGEPLEKSGDLDALAHRTDNISPFTINKEVALVRKCIEEILNAYIGKKIAIISDHGLTYLSQLVQGKNLAGVDSDHHGRVAIRKNASTVGDSSYLRLDDNKTLCALRHESLCAKVPSGQGIHGGCTPEEVLVPIFIISSCPAPTNWSAQLLSLEISGSTPRARFSIKNLPSTEVPKIKYNNGTYRLHNMGGDIYETDDMILDASVQDIILVIGAVERDYKIKVSSGVQEDDLFDF